MSSTKYYIKGTLKGTRCYDYCTDTLSGSELVRYLIEIEPMFKKDKYDELAQYIHQDDTRYQSIYGVVTEIWVGVKVIGEELFSWTEVTTTRKLTASEKKALLDYLTGQFSDGYGEGLEQQEFLTEIETETSEEYDEDEDEYYDEEYDVEVNYYLHLWQHNDFELEFVDESDVEKLQAPRVIKPRCKLVGQDGNIFNLVGIASRTLKRANQYDQAKEMQNRVWDAGSYSEALSIIAEYVEVE